MKSLLERCPNAGHDLLSFDSSVVVSYTALISSLAAAEARCMKLEQQLQHMKKMLLNVKADRHSMLKEQVRLSSCSFLSWDHIQNVAIVDHRHSCCTVIDSTSAKSQIQNYIEIVSCRSAVRRLKFLIKLITGVIINSCN